MFDHLTPFLLHWAVTALSLWLASYLFSGIRFADKSSLIVSALLLGLANAIVRPVLIIVTLPITIVSLGFFLLVINALMLLLVAKLVRGFTIAGFWTAFFASIFIALMSFAIDNWQSADEVRLVPARSGRLVETHNRAVPPAWIPTPAQEPADQA